MRDLLTSISDYMSWFVKEYKQVLATQNERAPLKLIDKVKCKKTGETVFKVQFIGKNVCLEYRAKELFSEDKILNNFSKHDIKAIVAAAKDDEAKCKSTQEVSRYSIDAISFCNENKQRLYNVKYSDDEAEVTYVRSMTATEINQDKEFILHFDKESIKNIAFQAGKESVLAEIELFKSAKRIESNFIN